MTDARTAQKDAGEPAISPDGHYLYYSQGRHAGARSSNTTRIRTASSSPSSAAISTRAASGPLVNRPGGSVTPRPSPDGKHARVHPPRRLGSQLFLQELDDRRGTPIFDKLDKDLQEAWTVHGVYPQYAWTPDSRHIVIWGQGKIWKVDVAARSARRSRSRARVRADDHERRAISGHGAPGPVSRPDAARRHRLARRLAGRVQRARPHLHPARSPAANRRGSPPMRSGADRSSSIPPGRPTAGDSCSRPGTTRPRPRATFDVASTARSATSSRRPGTTSRRRSHRTAAGSSYRKAGSDGSGPMHGAAEPGSTSSPVDGRSAPRLVRERRRRAAVRSHRHAPVLPRAARDSSCSRA